MRYILNKEGYISDVSFGATIMCSLGTCTKYTGKVPNGYSSIEDWHTGEIERLNAWKVVDGNLVFDANRDYKLKIKFDQENNENSHVTRKEMGISAIDEMNPYTDLYPSNQSAGGYITSVDETFNKVGNLPTEEVNLSVLEEQDLDLIELEFIGNNFLPNTATSTSNNGISYTQNKDKTIDVSGIATEKSTLNLAGTDTSVRNILTFKANESYLLFGLEGLSIEFYHYDGSDRTLVGTYSDGVISFDEDTNITQVVLTVDKGTSIYTTIKPMLKLISSEYPVMPMTEYKGNLFNFDNILYKTHSTRMTITGTANNFTLASTHSTGYDSVVWDLGKINYDKIYYSFGTDVTTSKQYGYIMPSPDGTYENRVLLHEIKDTNNSVDLTQYQDYHLLVLFRANSKTTYVSQTITNLMFSRNPIDGYKEYNGRDGQYYVDGVSTQEVRSGKNLFNKDTVTLEKTLTATGGAGTNAGSVLSDYIKIKPNTNYYLSSVRGGYYVRTSAFYDENKTFISIAGISGEENVSGMITSPANAVYVRIVSGVDYYTRCQMEEGTTATEYEAYGVAPSPDYPSEIINIYKAGTYNAIVDNRVYEITIDEDLRGLPNGIGDRLWLDKAGVFDIERKVGRVVLNGSESGWSKYKTLTNNTIFQIPFTTAKPPTDNDKVYLSDYFNGISRSEFVANNDQIGLSPNASSNSSTYIILGIPNSISTTLADFKTWLSTHNAEVQYELTTSTTDGGYGTSYDEFEYEEYKNNTTLIDLAGNKLTIPDKITIKDNQIILFKENGVETYLGDTVMPRTYTPYTHAYSHQKVYIGFKYKDPRNVDITKINLKGLISITDVETEYNFCEEDLTRIQNYIMGTGSLTDAEMEVYDINGDGAVTSYDYVMIRQMIDGTISNKVTGTLEINSTQSKRAIALRDEDGKILTSVGMNGIFTPSLSVNGALVEEKIGYTEIPTTQFLNGARVYKRLYTGTMPTTTGTTAVIFNYDFDAAEVWIDEGISFLTSDTTTLPVNFYINPNDYLRMHIRKQEKSVEYVTGQLLSYWKYNIVLAYTKEGGTETPEEPETPTEEVIQVNKSSTITGSTSSSVWTFKSVATEESINTVNNTSTVTITNYIGRPSTSGNSYFMGTLTNNYKCGDQTYSETVYKNSGTISAGGWYKLGSKTFTVKHTTEPMKINVGGSMSTSAFTPSSASASGSITLTRI